VFIQAAVDYGKSKDGNYGGHCNYRDLDKIVYIIQKKEK